MNVPEQNKAIRKALSEVFERRDCVPMVRPVENEKDL